MNLEHYWELFSPLDRLFGRLMLKLHGRGGGAELFLAAALSSRASGEGHVCLDLVRAAEQPLGGREGTKAAERLPAYETWRAKLAESRVVGGPGEFRPLILDRHGRLYLHRFWEYETLLAEDLIQRAGRIREDFRPQRLKAGLERFFSPGRDDGLDWQKAAAAVAVLRGLCVITGGPGTGKSTVVLKILTLLQDLAAPAGVRAALAAPTGKAAARLKDALIRARKLIPPGAGSSDAAVPEPSTIHRLLGPLPGGADFRHNARDPLPADVVIIDEASMVDLALMSRLVQAVPAESRLILLGDRDQLASVEAGAVLGDICGAGRDLGFSPDFGRRLGEVCGQELGPAAETAAGPPIRDCIVELRRNYRFAASGGIGGLSLAVKAGAAADALARLQGARHPELAWQPLPALPELERQLDAKVLRGYRLFFETGGIEDLFTAFDEFRILCALRRGPYGTEAVNRIVERIVARQGGFSAAGRQPVARPILITVNDYSLGLYNGDLGMILPDLHSDGRLRAFFRETGGSIRKLPPLRLPAHETAWAMTVHKAQGSEFEQILLLLPDRVAPVLSRELAYTAVTRARRALEIWGTEPVFREAVERRITRTSGLRDALWNAESGLRKAEGGVRKAEGKG